MKKWALFLSVISLFFGIKGVANATLWDRGGGLIYDDVLNITLLQNANYAATELTDARRDAIISTVGSVDGHALTVSDFHKSGGTYTGKMTWWGASAWVDQLVFSGYDDWRLPETLPVNGISYIMDYRYDGSSDWGYNISLPGTTYEYSTASEMTYMYYVGLENLGRYDTSGTYPQPGWGLLNTEPFEGLQPYFYWSDDYPYNPSSAWTFWFEGGQQDPQGKDQFYFAWAVRDGDVIPHTHCVSTSAELQDALNVAATNSTPDIIRILSSVDPYVGNFVYTSTEPYGLTIEGGYNPDCTERVDPANTVLDGGSNGIVLLLSTPEDPAKFIVEGITLQNGYPQPSLQVITDYGEVTLNNNNISNNPRGGVYLSKIDKVTLNNNNISDNNYGGGIHLEYINTVTLNENIINNNDRIGGHVQYGGGIFGDSAGDVSLTNNTITNNWAGWGGGVFLKDSGIVTFTNNNISNNICESPGGGVRVYRAVEVNLVNNIINNNISTTAGGGGAKVSVVGTAILTNNLISNNSAQGGGGADLAADTAILTNNTIINNSTSQSGSGIFVNADTAILTNNTISNNSAQNNADSDGGGVKLVLRPGGIANIYNNIIWNNHAESIGADLYINNDPDGDGSANGTVNLYNNDFDLSNGFYIEVDDDSVVYSDNLNNVDPEFDIDGYHLTDISPCIDAGMDAGVYDDIDGDSRPQGDGIDIGADEYVQKYLEISIDIKPGSDPNSINCYNDKGIITLAILTTDDFDATTVDHTLVSFEEASETHIDRKSGNLRRHEEDVDGDGDTDLVFHFRQGDTNLSCESVDGTLTGETFDGQNIEGTDAVNMVPAR
jgi:hypothetical protein